LPPVDGELALCNTIADPIEAHVNGFGASLFDSTVGDARRTGVVRLDGSGRLWMSHVSKGGAKPGSLLAVVEESAKFRFSCGRDDNFENGAGNMDSAVDGRGRMIGIRSGNMNGICRAEEEETSSATAGLGL
jgi:hypothetical protein